MITWQVKVSSAMCACALAACTVFAAEFMPRSEWHNLVNQCSQDPKVLEDTMGKVSPADQVALLAEVNEAISKMPGSPETKGAMFYAANSQAVKSAKGTKRKVLAEVFATVPPEYLTDINERFAKELFNRNADETKKFSDEDIVRLSTNTMAVINARCEKAENSGVRETFAILMFLRASEGSPKNLSDLLVATLPSEKNQQLAKDEWIRPAMGDGVEQTYDPMLGASQAGDEPDHAVVAALTRTSASDIAVAMLGDLDTGTSTANIGGGAFQSYGVTGMVPNNDPPLIGINQVPRHAISNKDGDNPYYTKHRGDTAGRWSSGGGTYPNQGSRTW